LKTRPITPDDFDFLFELHRQTFQAYVEQTWGWDEERQRHGFHGELKESPFEIVQLDGGDVGCISVIDKGSALNLNYLALLPSVQNEGLGSVLVRSLQ
jgi:N-acetylglutamate synthase-like GNAT family acetyltransferase